MPQRPSAAKSLRKNQARRNLNKSAKSKLHTETVKFERAAERGDREEAAKQLELVTKLLHQAAAKGIMHKNTASRKLSRLQSTLNALE